MQILANQQDNNIKGHPLNNMYPKMPSYFMWFIETKASKKFNDITKLERVGC
jgi:hypothetical protein